MMNKQYKKDCFKGNRHKFQYEILLSNELYDWREFDICLHPKL